MKARKTVLIKETIYADSTGEPCDTVTRIAILAVVQNPFAGRFVEDISSLFDVGGQLGKTLMSDAVSMLKGDPVSYGKAAIIGVNGDLEHGGAVIHPKLGKPMRAAVGGGEAVISSNAKIASVGTSIDIPLGHKIDIPLGHKDEAWSFNHFDTMTVMIADAPRPDEIVICMAVADGGRPIPRVGSGPVTD